MRGVTQIQPFHEFTDTCVYTVVRDVAFVKKIYVNKYIPYYYGVNQAYLRKDLYVKLHRQNQGLLWFYCFKPNV